MTNPTESGTPVRQRVSVDVLEASGWVRAALWTAVIALSLFRFYSLTADFPNESPWLVDQAKFTDEGWWANAAVAHTLTGHWFVRGDYNPAVALPVWPFLLSLVFDWSGVSIVAARALNVTFSLATLGVVFLLVRRFTNQTSTKLAPVLAVLLLAASPFAFAFSRLAILDTLVVLEFCVLLLAASYASQKRVGILAGLALLVTVMVLTKTTAVLLLPAVFWMAWSAMGRRPVALLHGFLSIAVAPAALLQGYGRLVSAWGYGGDYRYFFDVNAMPALDWRQTVATLSDFIQNCFWIDRVLYPVGVAILVLALAWKRKLWGNPLFTACWIALGMQAAFIFRRQEDYAPRYFLVMLAPLVIVVALTFAELRMRAAKIAAVLMVAMAASFVANAAMIGHFLMHRDYDLRDAANSIATIVRAHPEQRMLVMGASANQISLMTGLASINDGYGTEPSEVKVETYKPGWYLEWNDAPPEGDEFPGYSFKKMGSYPVFDDGDRTTLILYELVHSGGGSKDAADARRETP